MPKRPSFASSCDELARQDPLLEPLADLGHDPLADELAHRVADRPLLVVEERVDREEVARVEIGSAWRWSPREASDWCGQIVETLRRAAGVDTVAAAANHVPVADVETRGVEQLLAAARERIERIEPEAAWAAASTGEALIVDLRSSDERRRYGIVPGSLHVPRSVLEWRGRPDERLAEPASGGS